MFNNFEVSEVKWVSKKLFGFIKNPAGGKDLFFHQNGAITFSANGDEVIYKPGLKRDPVEGDHIVFLRGENKRGAIASPWGYLFDYEETILKAKLSGPVVKETARTSIPAIYRVRKETRISRLDRPYTEIVWEGSNLHELAREHPRTDTLFDDFHTSIFTPFTTHYYFEAMVSSEWISVPDPRPMVRDCELAAQ
jgi:cold shock CspA family protein